MQKNSLLAIGHAFVSKANFLKKGMKKNTVLRNVQNIAFERQIHRHRIGFYLWDIAGGVQI